MTLTTSIKSHTLEFSPKQEELFFPEHHFPKYNIVPKGRRAGVTRGASKAIIRYGLDENLWFLPKGPIDILWGDTVQSNISNYYEKYFFPELMQIPPNLWKWRAQEHILKVGRATVVFKSAERTENWEGFGYHIIFLNEAGIILEDDYLFNNAVLPMLGDFKESRIIAAGTPKGKRTKNGIHKFYDLYLKGLKDPERYRIMEFTYRNNPFITREEIALLSLDMDEHTRLQEIEGKFVDLTEKKFLYAFKEDKHVIKSYKPHPHLPLLFSFDFNKDPMTCLIGQQVDIKTCYIFDEMIMKSGSTPEICEMLLGKYSKWIYNDQVDVTGDATGRNRSALTKGNLNHYRIIKDALNLTDDNILVPKQNLALKDSRILNNSVLQNANVFITEDCRQTINDLHSANVGEEGELIKSQAIGLHLFDGFRYFIHALFKYFIKDPERYGE